MIIITIKNLMAIEDAVGYGSRASVRSGYTQGSLEVRVEANHPVTNDIFTFTREFTEKEMTYSSPPLMLEAFTNQVRAIFYEEFKKPVGVSQQRRGLSNRG